MSSPIAKSVTRTLSLISAALLLQVGSAAAETPARGLQQQVVDLLAGRNATRVPQSISSKSLPAADAQVFAQQLLLGTLSPEPTRQSGGPSTSNSLSGRIVPLLHADTQTTVQKLLVGPRDATAVGS
jgi:hypothetical protein